MSAVEHKKSVREALLACDMRRLNAALFLLQRDVGSEETRRYAERELAMLPAPVRQWWAGPHPYSEELMLLDGVQAIIDATG